MIKLIPLKMQYCEEVTMIAKECLPEHWSLKEIQDVLQYDHNIYFVAQREENNQIVGFAGIMVLAEEAELLNIAVLSEFRKKGIGQQLLTRLLEEAKIKNVTRMLLEVRKSNEVAINFYKRNQFEILGDRKKYYTNPVEDALIMDCKIIACE